MTPERATDLLRLRDAAIGFYETASLEAQWALLTRNGRAYFPMVTWSGGGADHVERAPRVVEVDQYLVDADHAMVSVAWCDVHEPGGRWCSGHLLWVREPEGWANTGAHPAINNDTDWGVHLDVVDRRGNCGQFWERQDTGWVLLGSSQPLT